MSPQREYIKKAETMQILSAFVIYTFIRYVTRFIPALIIC